ncbi:carbonic anhydrase [Undibacterium luofuense]|uniref:carbonic anhydrase n=1 Tax=Undibacterium luofuense TaxID=2828733 RepID=A0A941DK72_9BURK|nr:carbonic anhydrase family protein [Undibacterium luofuense]MBR7782283.1 carbonic anhydrase family protein [Undibacterium luofuense]
MRRYLALLVSMLIATVAQANDSSASATSKPIKPAAKESRDKEESGSSDKKDSKKSAKESKETKESKEALQPDELAAKIAEKLAVIRKDKEEATRAAPRPVVRPAYSQVRRTEPAKAKEPEHGSAAVVAAMGGHGAVHWSYQGETGPQNWGKMNPANAKCDSGDRQSPIDIRDGIKVDLEPIMFDYKLSGFNVIDNGHTIQVNPAAGNYITVMGKSYELAQFHFHKPSEERISGKSFEMVVHLVHKDIDGRLAVIAILLERGKAHSVIQQVWNNLPLEKNEAMTALTALDLNLLLPVKREYYTYMGSLTTPPCSEGVLWMVMKEPVEISHEQLAIFSRLYPMNARPIQKTSGRLIKESN